MSSSALVYEKDILEGISFSDLAAHIDSTLDPYFENQLTNLSRINVFFDQAAFGRDKFIPVGSCVDGSKVNIPDDTGDLDILIVANKVKLKERLFHYDSVYPAFLHIKADGVHKTMFAKSNLPLGQQYLPISVLKSMDYIHGIAKWYFKCMSWVHLGDTVLNLQRNTAVGVEGSQLDSQPLHNTGFFDEWQRHIRTYNFAISRISSALVRMQNLPARLNGHLNSNTKAVAKDNQVFPETFLKVLDGLSKEHRHPSRNPGMHPESGKTKLFQKTPNPNRAEEHKENCNKANAEGELCFINDLNALTSTCLLKNKTDDLQGNLKKSLLRHKEHHSVLNKNIKELQSINTITERQLRKLGSVDYVLAFQIEGWPRVAEEWLYRKRCWPPRWVIGSALNAGCQVVAKRPFALCETPESPDTDSYFRLSFALVEMELAHALNEVQIKCWRILKAYQKAFLQSNPKVLTSYLWKNVLFWVCETCHISFWTNDNLVLGVRTCLKFMSECLETGILPFYFVPRMNLLNGRRQETMFQVNRKLDLIQKNPVKFLKRFLVNPPDSENIKVDLMEIENKLSYGNAAESFDDIFDQLVDSWFLESVPVIQNEGSDKFRDHILALHQNIFRTVKEAEEKTKTTDNGAPIKWAETDEETQAKSNLMNYHEFMNYFKECFEFVMKGFTHCTEVRNARIHPLLSKFKTLPSLLQGDKEDFRKLECKVTEISEEIIKLIEARLQEHIKSEETDEEENQKMKTLLSLVPMLKPVFPSFRSSVSPGQQKDERNETADKLFDIDLD